MKAFVLATRTTKEIIRDPINIIFGLGFPFVLLLLLSAIQNNIPINLFAIERLAPGISVFGLSFFSLFSALLVARDRESAFLSRLYTAPIKPADFIISYALPFVPLGVLQTFLTYFLAVLLGLKVSLNILLAVIFNIPMCLVFVSIGLIAGSTLGTKQVGGICGALLTNLAAWLSGIWFDLSLVGGTFEKVAKALPFLHAVELERKVITGNFSDIMLNILILAAYFIILSVIAVLCFKINMKKQ